MGTSGLAEMAERIDALLKSGGMVRLGMGSRRSCHRLQEGGLCVKCYRSDAEIAEGKEPGSEPAKPLPHAVVREIQRCRFDERRNTCCQEYDYWRGLRATLPEHLAALFPATMEKLLLPSRGWCVVEELIENADGTAPAKFHEAFIYSPKSKRAELAAALDSLTDDLIRHAVRIYDPQNILVQRSNDGAFRLRIADFEPATRTLISLDRLSPLVVRMKLRRRFARYRRMFNLY